VPMGGSRISGLGDNKKLVHLALGLFTLGALFQNNLSLIWDVCAASALWYYAHEL